MKHYSDEAWLDFTRQLLPADEMSRMQVHLGGCERCQALHRIWRAVWELTTEEAAYEPDKAVIHSVKAAYAGARWKPAPNPMLSAMLVFDSFATAGAAAGFRSISPAARHLLYSAGRLSIDVRLTTYRGTGVTIVGQVLETEVHARASTTRVSVSKGDATLARTFANEFGEFQFDVEDGPDLRLRLDVEQYAAIVLTLPTSS